MKNSADKKMAESLTTSADATKDKRPNSGSSEGKSQGKNLILENFLIFKWTQKPKVRNFVIQNSKILYKNFIVDATKDKRQNSG